MQFYDKRIILRIDRETLQELKEIAKANRMSVSSIIRRFIYKGLKEIRKQKKENSNAIPTIPRY